MIVIKGDSRLVIRQINGTWQISIRNLKKVCPGNPQIAGRQENEFCLDTREQNEEANHSRTLPIIRQGAGIHPTAPYRADYLSGFSCHWFCFFRNKPGGTAKKSRLIAASPCESVLLYCKIRENQGIQGPDYFSFS